MNKPTAFEGDPRTRILSGWFRGGMALGLALALAGGISLLLLAGTVRPSTAQAVGADPVPALDLPGHHVDPPRFSPDGRLAAVAVAPTGAETARFARILITDPAGREIRRALSGHTPRWQMDGQLAFVRADAPGFGLFDPRTGRTRLGAEPPPILVPELIPPHRWEMSDPGGTIRASGVVSYPATIRVIHHSANGCRSVPVGQIDVIPFEDYVARVVPNEVPALWPFNAVAAQAVAARTYGWYQILQNRPDYDVTDWANFQMMCDARHPASDAAVGATAGVYLAAQNDPDRRPIIAMYSAENGHPTLTNSNVPYLQAVPDLFALGKVRNGHGYGLSQWGAYRRASAGHHYLQILGHYYTGVHALNGLDPDYIGAALVDPAPPLGGFLGPGGLYWRAITPPLASSLGSGGTISPSLTLTASAGLTESLVFTPTSGVWQPGSPLAEGASITAQLWISGTEVDRRVLVVDTLPPPAPSLTGPVTITQRTLPLTVTVGETGALVGLSQGWVWQGEDLLHTANSGAVISDAAALNGVAWQAQTGVHQWGAWYGPYTDTLAAGRAYRALFRLRAGSPPASSVTGLLSDTVIARLDVTDLGGTVRLGLRDVRAAEFPPGAYTEIGVDFYLFNEPDGLEFRVDWRGNTDLALDQVQVWTLPTGDWQTGPLAWQIPARIGPHTVQARAFDPAQNPSPPISLTVNAVDVAGPRFGSDFGPTGWQTALPVAASLDLSDELSGLDPAGGQLHINGPGGPLSLAAALSRPDRPDLAQRIQASVTALADGHYTATFQAGDQAGHTAMSGSFPLWLDTTPPAVAGTVTSTVPGAALTQANGWYLDPVRVILAGTDATSGVAHVRFGVNGSGLQNYIGPVVFNSPGSFALSYQAEDGAGNVSPLGGLSLGVDLAVPTATLSLDQSNPLLVVARWSGGDDAAGVARFDVQSRLGADAWQPLAMIPANGEQIFVVAEGTVLSVRVRAVDGANRTGAWVSASAAGTARKHYLPLITR